MRLFIASCFSDRVLDRVRDLQGFGAPLFGNTLKWVNPGNIHLTYVFLGESAGEPELPVLRKSLDETACAVRKIPVTVGGLGAFPSLERPRVLWLGLREGGDALKAVALKLYRSLAAEGFVFEREFSAHVTIARARTCLARAALARLAERAEASGACGDIVASLNLMESRLTGAGPEYRTLYAKELL